MESPLSLTAVAAGHPPLSLKAAEQQKATQDSPRRLPRIDFQKINFQKINFETQTMSNSIMYPSNPSAPETLELDPNALSVFKVKERIAKMPADFASNHQASRALVVPPETLHLIRQAENLVVNQSNSTQFKNQAIDAVADSPHLMECLEWAKMGSTSEIFLRACTHVPDTADKAMKKIQNNDMCRLWRLHPATLDAIKSNAASNDSIYTRTPDNESIFKRIEKLKSATVEHEEGKKSPMEVDYPRITDFGEGAKLASTWASLAASKAKVDAKEKAAYEKSEGRADAIKRKHVELLSNPDSDTVVFKLPKVVSNSLTSDGSLIVVLEKEKEVEMAAEE